MGLAVRVHHPAIVAWIPRRARNVRTRLVGAVIEAMVPEAGDGAFEAVDIPAGPDDDRRVLLRDGVLWRPLRGSRADGSVGDLEPGDFARHLAWEGLESSPMRWSLIRTPLCATTADGDVERTVGPYGFEVGDLETARAIHVDGRPRAADRARRYLETQFMVAGDRVLHRYRPLATIRPGGPRRGVPVSIDDGERRTLAILGDVPDRHWYDLFPTRPSTLDEALDRIPRAERPPMTAELRAWRELGDAVTGARDGATLVDLYSGPVTWLVHGLLGTNRRDGAAREELQSALDALLPHARAARTGSPDDGVQEALAAMQRGLDAVDRHIPNKSYHADRSVLADWIASFYRPRADALPEADARAIGSLANGR